MVVGRNEICISGLVAIYCTISQFHGALSVAAIVLNRTLIDQDKLPWWAFFHSLIHHIFRQKGADKQVLERSLLSFWPNFHQLERGIPHCLVVRNYEYRLHAVVACLFFPLTIMWHFLETEGNHKIGKLSVLLDDVPINRLRGVEHFLKIWQ